MHPEAITSEAKKVFEKLKNFSDFYLAGGTGLALQIGHRVSVDFDFFSNNYISEDLLSRIEEVFKDSDIKIIINQPEQLTVLIDGVNLSFIYYPFPVFSGPIDYQGIKILPSLEIASMKAYTLGRRATLKDYIDLYFVVKEKIGTLEEIIELCEKKHGEKFDPRLFLEQLIYLEDVEPMKIQFLRETVSQREIQDFFEKQIKKIKI